MNLDHIGVAVLRMGEALGLYRDRLGLRLAHEEELPSQGVRVAFLEGDSGCSVELLEPLGEEGPVARFLKARGPGLHHLALRSEALEPDMKRLGAAGVAPLQESPRPGARGHRVCFFSPRDAGGVLLELVGP